MHPCAPPLFEKKREETYLNFLRIFLGMIEHYSFGEFIVDGKRFKSNIVLLGRTVKPARYLPGHDLTLEDIKPLVDFRPEVIIIGTGAYGVMKVKNEIKQYIEERGIKLIIAETKKACDKYNELLRKGVKVAAFLHNTC